MSQFLFDPTDSRGVMFLWISCERRWLASQEGDSVKADSYREALFAIRKQQYARRGVDLVLV
jgi:hypothetical protein